VKIIRHIGMKKKWGFILSILVAVVLGTAAAGSTATITGEALQAAVQTHVEKHSPWPKGRIRVEFPETVADVAVPSEKVTIKIKGRANEDFIGQTSFTASLRGETKPLREEHVKATLWVLMDVVVSTKSLSSGTVLGAGDVKVLQKWYDAVPQNRVSDLKEVIGKKLSVSINPHMEITKNVLKDCPVVRRNQPVRIMLDNGTLCITATGVSQEDGILGEVIRVQNTASKRIIHARVRGNALVAVDF
jgi:flagella basal body P-ring formation protein FlgA